MCCSREAQQAGNNKRMRSAALCAALAAMALVMLFGTLMPRVDAPVRVYSARVVDGPPQRPQLRPPAAHTAVPAEAQRDVLSCPVGCTAHGNCNELSGECACPLTHGGAACDEPRMPACELGDDVEAINLSFLTSEAAWQQLRDVQRFDVRRASPPHLWLGLVSCACVLQAVSVFSLSSGPMAHSWPKYIEHPFLSMQRAVCVDSDATVGQLWESGGGSVSGSGGSGSNGGGGGGEVPWASVPVFAFLKQFPAHSPTLLPPGMVSEALYAQSTSRYAIDLDFNAAAPRPRRATLRSMLPSEAAAAPLRPAACGPRGCHGGGWCDGGGEQGPRCRCASELGGSNHRTPRRSLSSSRACAPTKPGTGRRLGRHRRAQPLRGAILLEEMDRFGPDRWRHSMAEALVGREDGPAACPNACTGLGRCRYGFCHCEPGHWGLDCGMSAARVSALRSSTAPRSRIYVYELPPALRRSCNWWRLAEDVGRRAL